MTYREREFGGFSSGEELVASAVGFACAVHAGQKRKYTDEDYYLHCLSVMGLIEDNTNHPPPYAMAAAIMHDCIEDATDPQAVAYAMRRMFPSMVFKVVAELTDTPAAPGLNRAARKAMDRERLAKASYWAQSIKCADMIDNTKTIVDHDQKFAVKYLEEKALMLEGLNDCSPKLKRMAQDSLVEAQKKLIQYSLAAATGQTL